MNSFKLMKTSLSLSILFLLATVSMSGCIAPRMNYASFYEGRQNFLAGNYGIARRQLMGPAKAGNPEAQYAIGYMYLNGLGTPSDPQMGLKWIRMSASSGYPPAQEALYILSPHHPRHSTLSARHLNTRAKTHPILDQPANEAVITYASTTQPATAEITDSLISQHRSEKKEALKNNDSAYTIQLLGSHDLKNIQDFVKKHQLGEKAYFYPIQKKGKTWHTLLYGSYASFDQAKQAIQSLPENLKSLNPWVKRKEYSQSFGS